MTEPNDKGTTAEPPRHPLPDQDLITYCELVTWLATGRARSADTLKRLMSRHRGQRGPKYLWDSFDHESAGVISILRENNLIAYGSPDGGPHQPIPGDYLINDVYGEPVSDTIGPDPLAWERGSYPEGLATYRNVRFRRSDVLRLWGKEEPGQEESAEPEPEQEATLATEDAAEESPRPRGRWPDSRSRAKDVWALFDKRKDGFTFKRGELTKVSKEIGQETGYRPGTVIDKISATYWELASAAKLKAKQVGR